MMQISLESSVVMPNLQQMLEYGSDLHLVFITFLLSILVLATRFLPFMLKNIFENSVLLNKVCAFLPSTIIFLLIFHTLEEVNWQVAPYGTPEIASLLIAIILHIWKKNLFLSLLPSTCFYVYLINYIV